MNKLILSLLFSFCIGTTQSQNFTINIGPNVGFMDSSFVIQSGTTETYSSANHPGAGPYMNAEIYLCQGSVLNYNYQIGTSNVASFYLEPNATLNMTPQGTIANIYMKSGSTLNVNNSSGYLTMRREPNVNILNAGSISYFMDSVFNTINFTFNGWPNNVSPCTISTNTISLEAHNQWINLQNPANSSLQLEMVNYTEPITLTIWNTLGQKVMIERICSRHQTVSLSNAPLGLLFYTFQKGQTIIQSGKLWHE